ncbi:MAG: hypothetical protein QG556_695, partial [Pseudomonadota bacterium]|nr:hypothetical protein [Pseudomonadota bacterium]
MRKLWCIALLWVAQSVGAIDLELTQGINAAIPL